MVVAGLTSVLAALCYSEFAASVPVAGSAYTYAYATLGEFVAWVIGWDLILEYALGAATVAVGWSGILITLLGQLGLTLPGRVQRGAGHDRSGRGRRSGDRGLESPGDPRHRGGHGPAGPRRQRVRLREQRHRGRSRSRSCSIVIAAGALFVDHSELASLHPAEHRDVRRVRVERHPAGRGRDLLRVHRLRRRVHVRAGGAQPAARHAARHPRIAGDLHGPLRAGLGRDGGARAVQGDAESAGAARARRSRSPPSAPPGRPGRRRWPSSGCS